MADGQKRGFVVVSHPDPTSFNHALAKRVARSWATAGILVTLHDLYAENFDPIFSVDEFRGEASRDPLVRAHIAELKASDLLAVVHPNCWGAPPAMMKGWIDRVFAPDAAYGFEKGSDAGDVPVGLRGIQTALVLNTGNTRADREQDIFGDPLDRIWRECILAYCGVAHVDRELFGVVAASSPRERRAWLDRADELARSNADRVLGKVEH
jgi:putative NADPH-quinone reductase